MRLTAKLEYRGSPEALKKELRPAAERGLREIGEFWHQEYLPLHFRSFARHRYNYEKRSPSYNQQKSRIWGHRLPLVWSGTMREELLGMAEIRANSKRVKIKLDANALRFSRRANYPDMRAEVAAIAPEEPQRFAELLDENVTQQLNEVDDREVVSFG